MRSLLRQGFEVSSSRSQEGGAEVLGTVLMRVATGHHATERHNFITVVTSALYHNLFFAPQISASLS